MSGLISSSNSPRVSISVVSRPLAATVMVARGASDRTSLAVLIDRSRDSDGPVAPDCSARSSSVSFSSSSDSTHERMRASRVRPPSELSPRAATTCSDPSAAGVSTATSRVPPPRSNTATFWPGDSGRLNEYQYVAARGSETSDRRRRSMPARSAPSIRRTSSAWPQPSGCVSTTSSGMVPPAKRRARSSTDPITAATTSTTGMREPANSTVSEPMARFGSGRNASGRDSAWFMATWPTSRPWPSANTADGSRLPWCDSASASAAGPPCPAPAARWAAAVFDVPKSMANRQPDMVMFLSGASSTRSA